VLSSRPPGRYQLIASAIAGRQLEVTTAAPGAPAWTDGGTVYVEAGATPVDQLANMIVQSALVGAGSLDPEVMRALGRRPTLARRYLAVEAHRALRAMEYLLPPFGRGLIDGELATRTRSPISSLELARTRKVLPEPPPVFGTILPRRVETVTGSRTGETSTSVHVPRRSRTDELEEIEGSDPDDRVFVDLFSSPVGGGGGLGRLLKKLFAEGRSLQGGPPGADSPTHRSRRPSGGQAVAISMSARPISASPLPVEKDRFTYPEWDKDHARYRPAWCTVVEVEPTAAELRGWVPPDTLAWRRPLARLGMELERTRRQLQGEEIDIDAAVEAQAELMAGAAPDEGVYIESQRRRRDLSVLLLVDVSGSAGEPGTNGRQVLDHERAAAAALAAALHEHGDRVAVYGFRSQGRSAVQVVRVKRFSDNLDATVMNRLGGLAPGAYTRLGAAIRHGTGILEREAGTTRRLLVVLSDGFAYDHGYERAYGEADARRALAESRRRGIGCLCLSLGAVADAAALRRVFGTASFGALPSADRLPPRIGPLFRSALHSAERQRLASQRRARTEGRRQADRKNA
jgi:hypothetical protein